jgi:hypothetical protein
MILLFSAPTFRAASFVGAAVVALALLVGCGVESAKTSCPPVPTYDVREMPSADLTDYDWLDDPESEQRAKHEQELADNPDETPTDFDAFVALWTRYREVLIELGEAAAQGCVTYPTPPSND